MFGFSRRNIWVTTKHYLFLNMWDSMSLSHPFSNMLTHGYFYFWWHCVGQIESAIHFSTNERFLKVVVMITSCYYKHALMLSHATN
jgi:hypothetical protein